MMKLARMTVALLAMFCVTMAWSAANAQGEVYIVVNANNATDSVSRSDLGKIFKGTKKSWDDGSKIIPVLQKSEVGAFYDLIGSSKGKYDKYWITLSLSGKAAPLKRLPGNRAVIEYVSGTSNGIGYVTSKDSLAGAKVLNVE